MKNILQKIKYFCLIIAIYSLGFFAFSSAVNAQSADILDILFEKGNDNPLFTEAKFLPGDSVTRWVKVKNISTTKQTIAVMAKEVANTDRLAEQLDLEIDATNIAGYNEKLSTFFSENPLVLSSLDPGETIRYYFSITLPLNTNNDYQAKTLKFDMVIGSALPGSQTFVFPEASSHTGSTRIVKISENKSEITPNDDKIVNEKVNQKDKISVLGVSFEETGFSLKEFIYLLLFLVVLIGGRYYLKSRKSF